jgi:hypothetical protein
MNEKWTPADVIRLVALIGALVFFGLGAFMMWRGISAEGAIDIKSEVLSGSIKTGSAGLFLAFLSFSMIVFVLASTIKKPQPSLDSRYPKSRNLRMVFWGLLVALLASTGLAAIGYGDGFSFLASFLGFMVLIFGIAYLTFLDAE